MVEEKTTKISRRTFLKYAGVAAGGVAITTAVGAQPWVAKGEEVVTTKIVEVPGAKKVVEVEEFKCPFDGLVFDTAAELKSHLEATHSNKPVWTGHLFGYI